MILVNDVKCMSKVGPDGVAVFVCDFLDQLYKVLDTILLKWTPCAKACYTVRPFCWTNIHQRCHERA